MPHRYGFSASARIAVPLAAALVAAIILPAILLRARDTAVLPIAAPAASSSRSVHTQTEPKPIPKQDSARHHAKPAARRSGHAVVVSPAHPAPAAGHRAAAHVKHAKAQPKHPADRHTASVKHKTPAVTRHEAQHVEHSHAQKAHKAAPHHAPGRSHEHHKQKAHGHGHEHAKHHGKGKS